MSIRPLHHLLVLVALATVGFASFAFATTAGARAPTAKPTVVLVHGAFADSSGFDGVIDRLRRDGYQVGAAPNRLLGLQSDAATVRGFLDSVPGRRRPPLRSDNRRGYFQVSIKGRKILVGHSYGGAVITWATSAAGVCPSSAGIGDSSHVSM